MVTQAEESMRMVECVMLSSDGRGKEGPKITSPKNAARRLEIRAASAIQSQKLGIPNI